MPSPFKRLARAADKRKLKAKLPKIKHKIKTPKLPKIKPMPEKTDIETIFYNIFTRRSVRHYLSKDVPDHWLARIIDAGIQAPSAGNYQPWEFVIVRDKEAKSHIVDTCFKNIHRSSIVDKDKAQEDWLMEAPVFIVVCINERLSRSIYGERGNRLYGPQGVAAAIENILLASNAYGLGTCWVGAFSEEEVATIIGCPKYMRPCAIITIGFPAEKPKKPKRHSLSDCVHLERFGRTLREKMVRPREQLF